MAKRSYSRGYSERVEEEEEKPAPKRTYTKTKYKTLRLLKDLKLNVTGSKTGELYVFPGAGSTVKIEENDANALLKKEKIKSCCGTIGSPYFEVVR